MNQKELREKLGLPLTGSLWYLEEGSDGRGPARMVQSFEIMDTFLSGNHALRLCLAGDGGTVEWVHQFAFAKMQDEVKRIW